LFVVGDSTVEITSTPRDAGQAAERNAQLVRIVLLAAQFEPLTPERLRSVDVVVGEVRDSARGA
jgi:hypothetical protein